MFSSLPFPVLRSEARGLELENLGSKILHWKGDALGRDPMATLISSFSPIAGKMREKGLELRAGKGTL